MAGSSHKEKLISGLGGFIAIFVLLQATAGMEQWLQMPLLFAASMGATAVLLFAAPHSPMAQPWNVIASHMLAALIGILVHQQIADPILSGAIAVGLAITAMYYLKCIHPPGGATALLTGGSGIVVDAAGWLHALVPIGVGACLMVAIALIINYPFPGRRYPAALFTVKPAGPKHKPAATPAPAYPDITHADLVVALSEIDTFMDVTEDDLLRIYDLATRSHRTPDKT